MTETSLDRNVIWPKRHYTETSRSKAMFSCFQCNQPVSIPHLSLSITTIDLFHSSTYLIKQRYLLIVCAKKKLTFTHVNLRCHSTRSTCKLQVRVTFMADNVHIIVFIKHTDNRQPNGNRAISCCPSEAVKRCAAHRQPNRGA